jgi:hypothetical protein
VSLSSVAHPRVAVAVVAAITTMMLGATFTPSPAQATAASRPVIPHGEQRTLPDPAGPVRLAGQTSTGALSAPLASATATADTSWDNLFQDYGDDSGAWSGGDGAQSLVLPDGKTMWFFGDTYLGKTNSDYTRPPLNTGLAHNSAVLQSGSKLGPTFAGSPGKSGYYFEDDYTWVSPPSGYSSSRYELINGDQVMENGVVYKFMQLADRDLHPDNFQYKLVGTVLESFGYDSSNGYLTPGSGSVVSVDDTASSDPVIWGAALLVSGGYVYIYGVQPYNAVSLYLARVPVGLLQDGAAWQFWDAKSPSCAAKSQSWTSHALDATALMPGVSEGFSVTDVNGTYVLLSNDNDSGSVNNAVVHYASCPSGFDTSSTKYTIFEPDLPYGYLAYEYRIVPQFSSGSDVLISYSTDSERVDDSCMYENYYNARIYRPRFLEIRLPGIGGHSGSVTQVSAATPPGGTAPPVPSSQETFHPENASDNWATENCQADTPPQSDPKISLTSNVNGQVGLSWTMKPTAMWLYTLTYCDTDEMSCGDNTGPFGVCTVQTVACGNILIWGTRSITMKYLTTGHKYQFTIATAKAVIDPLPAFSGIVTQNFPAPTGCIPLRSSDASDGYHFFTGAYRNVDGSIGGVSATIENYEPWVAPEDLTDTTSEWVMLVDSSYGGDEKYAQVGWWEGAYANRQTFTEWSTGPGDFYDSYYSPYKVNSNINYTMLFTSDSNPNDDTFSFEADGKKLQTLEDHIFTPEGGEIFSELHDQASQEPGDPTNLDHVTGMKIYLPAGKSGSWQNYNGTTEASIGTSDGQNLGTAPWQAISPANGTSPVNSFTTWDTACVASGSSAAAASLTGALASANPVATGTAQSDPVSSSMIAAVDQGSGTSITSAPKGVASAAVDHAALAEAPPGSKVLGTGLATAVVPYYGSAAQRVWLVSVDPAGGLQSVNSPDRTANYYVEIISAATGKWLMTAAGLAPGLSALPRIPAP